MRKLMKKLAIGVAAVTIAGGPLVASYGAAEAATDYKKQKKKDKKKKQKKKKQKKKAKKAKKKQKKAEKKRLKKERKQQMRDEQHSNGAMEHDGLADDTMGTDVDHTMTDDTVM